MSTVYQVSDVCKVYKNNIHALKNISLTIRQGEILGLIGVNGSGKTTLSSIIAGLIPATSGSIMHNDKPIYKNLSEYKRLIGLCPQKLNLDNRITVKENLINDGLFFGFTYDESVDKFNSLSEKLMLGKYEDSYPAVLSGGYKQRVAIARALMHNPKLVIFDEPTLGLDPNVRKNLWDIILNLKKEGISVLLTTHYMDEVEYLSDRICILHNGEMQFLGKLDELKSKKEGNLEEIMVKIGEDGI
ncbi:ABC transporter ATP-binding protein [Candidatus Cytomitobacter indipagum]|uniref:ABC transporter ATP-binding protein n=1 Tax=Candidatus Cytomitobacter indipagum TaxID=2601575 RepID=A0A5C0UE05_9PROT|nr:ABC transporter ATP-binding protein [Candidatus Cytomitobacter indipagum]QEK37883.1 ABC transporter ATP-binding protein [Candidatus Cytomitobacter indipagum]